MLNKYFLSILIILNSSLFVFPLHANPNTLEVQHIELTQDEDINDINKLRNVLDKITTRMKECMASGSDSITCQCRNTDLLRNFQDQLKETLQKHPSWKEQVIFYEGKDEQGRVVGISSSLSGYQKQSNMIDTLNCK